MLTVVCAVLIYYVGSLLLNYVFSLNLCGFASLVSSQFECGFLSALSTYIRFKFSYWLVIMNFIMFELELLLSFLFIYSVTSYFIEAIFLAFLVALLFDLYFD
jgi:NADH:ubiquinone oxidoreductase subunit 3 (subunit A)